MDPSNEKGGKDKPKLDCAGLSNEWEQQASIREHLRQENAVLFQKDLGESVKTASYGHISALLTVVLLRTAETPGHPQPPVDPLRAEITKLYKRCNNIAACEEQVITDSWMIRRFCSLVKIKTRLRKVSIATCLIFMCRFCKATLRRPSQCLGGNGKSASFNSIKRANFI